MISRSPAAGRSGGAWHRYALVAFLAVLSCLSTAWAWGGHDPGGTVAAGSPPVSHALPRAPPTASVFAGPAPRAGVSIAPTSPQASFTLGDSGTTPTAVLLNWSTPSAIGFGNYTVEVSPNGTAGSFRVVGVVTSASTTTFVADALSPGGANYWQVSVNAWVGSGSSNVLEVVQPALAFVQFWQPTSSSVQLNWTNNASYGSGLAFVSYVVYDGVGGGTPTAVATLTDAATKTFTISGLSSGSSYMAFVNTTDCLSGCGTATPTRSTTESNVVTFGTPAPLSVSVVGTRTLIDTGQSDLFLCTPSGGSSPFRFAWDFGNGTFVAGSSSDAHTWWSTGVQNITCRVTDSTNTQRTAATSILVNPSPALQVSANRTAADVGQSIAFLCAASGGTAPVTLSWSLGDGASLTTGNGTHSYAASGHFLAECVAKDATSTTVGASVPLNISPALVLRASQNAWASAPGTPLAFHVLALNGSGGYFGFRWTFGDVAGSYPGTNVTHTFQSAGNFTVVAHGKDSNGAVATSSMFVNVSDIAVTADPGATTIRTGSQATFSASAHGGAGAPFNFTWHFGDGAVGYGPTVRHAFDTPGSYRPRLVVTDALGANNTTVLPAVAVSAPVGPTPWLTAWTALLLLAVVAVVAAIAAYAWRRRAARAAFTSMQGRVPPTGPDDVVKGAKVCANCGVSNLPIRKTCTNCGRPLRRTPFA